MELASIINNVPITAQNEVIGKTKYKWRFIKANYQADIYNSTNFTILEQVICEILLNFGSKSFEELGAILGFSVINSFEDKIYKDNAEASILENSLTGLSESHVMLQIKEGKYELTKWGKEFTAKKIKLSCESNKRFQVYFDTLSENHELIFKLFKDENKGFQAEESNWNFPLEPSLKNILEKQTPKIFNPQLEELAFYDNLAQIGFSEYFAEPEVHALRVNNDFELKVFWAGKYNEDLSDILNSNEAITRKIIEDISFELASEGVISPDSALIEQFKYRWDWEKLSSKNLNFNIELLQEFQDFWNWKILSSNPHLHFSDNLVTSFEERWDWNSLSINPAIYIDLNKIDKYGSKLNLNKALERLNKDELLSIGFYKGLEKFQERLIPITLESLPWSSQLIDLFDSFNKIKWEPKRWTEERTRRVVKAFEGGEDFDYTVELYEPGFIDNKTINWNYSLLLKYWKRINYENLDQKSKEEFSKYISRNAAWNSINELLDFKQIINWEYILENPSINLNEEFLQTFEDSLDWKFLTRNDQLTHNEDLLAKFVKKWDWTFISKDTSRRFKLPFLEKFADYLDWSQLTQHPLFALTGEILQSFHKYFDWCLLSKSNRIVFTSALLEQFKDSWDWNCLSKNQSITFDNIKLSKFKDRWNWDEISKNIEIVLDSYSLIEFDKYWNWSLIATPSRILKFLQKYNWKQLSPYEHKDLVLKFAKQYNNEWTWGILKLSSYISLDHKVLENLESPSVWKEIILDDRFQLSDKNLEKYSAFISWDSLSANPRIVRPSNIKRFQDNWNWDILSSNTELIHNTNILWQHKEHWNWDIVSSSYQKFNEEILFKFYDYWRFDFVNYKLISFNTNLLEQFKDKLDWNLLSKGKKITLNYDFDLIKSFSEYWDWELLSQNRKLSFDFKILNEFADKWVIELMSYESIPFSKEVISLFVDRWDWNIISSSSRLKFNVKILEEFKNKWNWDLLSINHALKISKKHIAEFCEHWNWEALSQRQDWDFKNEHSGLLEEFDTYWNWKHLIQWPELFKKSSHTSYKFLAKKAEEVLPEIELNLKPKDFSKNHSSKTIYLPSPTISKTFEEKITDQIKRLPRTTYHKIILGRDTDEDELRPVIEYGKANFDEPYHDVTAEQRVLIYCYLNMRKHYFTKHHILDMIHRSDHSEFFSNNLFKKNTTIIDVGCGPLTAGLAYADFINREGNIQTKVTYFGVDISSQILNKAKDFASSPVFTPGSKFSFHRNWNKVSLSLENDQPILFIFSYLFANLNEEQTDDLANYTQAIIDQYQASNPIFLLFQNPDDYEKNKMFYRFKKNVSINVIGEGNDHVLYRTKNYSNSLYEPSQEYVKYVVMASPSTSNRLILHSFLNGQFPNN